VAQGQVDESGWLISITLHIVKKLHAVMAEGDEALLCRRNQLPFSSNCSLSLEKSSLVT
jgi:hypothetical protein